MKQATESAAPFGARTVPIRATTVPIRATTVGEWSSFQPVLASLVFLLVCISSAPAQTGPVVARAASVSGLSLIYSGDSVPAGLTAGYILNPGDRIDTRGGGRVVIDLSDGSMVVVQPESVIVLKDFQQASSLRELFDIVRGMVRVRINHFGGRPNPYRMNSPTASIAVRGTEFSIEVSPQGDTQVVVYEGVVEVSSLADPDQTSLIEAGRGVLVQGSQVFPFVGRNDADHDQHPPMAMANGSGPAPPQPQDGQNAGQHPDSHSPPGGAPHAERDNSPPATPSIYDRYIAGLSDIGQVPFLYRYNAAAEPYLDSLENPAYATGFTSGEGRVFVLPSISGLRGLQQYQGAFGPGGTLPGDYSLSPQFSLFSPIPGSNFTIGGSASASLVGTSGVSTGAFYSGALVVARRFGSSSFGVELDSLKGTGSLVGSTSDSGGPVPGSASDVSQTRLTAGFSRDLKKNAKLGIFYRYAFISANDAGQSGASYEGSAVNSTRTSGHSSEFGMRLRGAITPRLSYGVAGDWVDVSLQDALLLTDAVASHQRDRSQRGSLAFGLGFALTRRIVWSFDATGGAARNAASRTEDATGHTLQNGDANPYFVSVHTAIQANLSRHLFVSASLMNVWQSNGLNVDLFPDQYGQRTLVQDSFFPSSATTYPYAGRFSDFGAGWRFTPNFFVQYLYSTDYGASAASHTLMLRYTFRLRRE